CQGGGPGNPAAQTSYIHGMPAWVLEDFCQKMDCLNDYDWMRFASYVIIDQTELRKIKCMEKTGISITRELMWWWGVRLATVEQLLELLQKLQLFRAAQVILDWRSISNNNNDPAIALLEPPKQETVSLHPMENKCKTVENGIGPSPSPDSTNPCSSSTPRQEMTTELPSGSLLWAPREVIDATNGFREENRIDEGVFANVYRGQRHNTMYVVKRLKEVECTNPNLKQRFFHTEVQICFRCCHHNILQLLGFSIESGFHCLIYPYMLNGSLEDRLQCQGGSDQLTWEKRISISIGLIRAIQHLHHFGILHGNVKSSNVLLDENFTPKLGHSGLRLCPAEKKSEYAVMKTKVLQASLAYLPEDVIRHGQLTEKVDLFGCGIVLAEMLTGLKAMDERRHPIFLKDLITDEIQIAKALFCCKDRAFEKLAAKEICCKYLDRKVGQLPADTAICFATAVCLSLRKKNPDIAEVYAVMEMAECQVRNGSFNNAPEETDDETASPTNDGYSGGNSEIGAMANLPPPLIRVLPPEMCCGPMSRLPCESDESSNFAWDPTEGSACLPQSNSCTDPENALPSDSRRDDKVDSGKRCGHQHKGRGENVKYMALYLCLAMASRTQFGNHSSNTSNSLQGDWVKGG
uniref:Interleukin-1 receptor-associated kinase-like 2 n=1 Tax=Sphenodon punctatus TaxID=8508 RepID=A0A8D0HEX8_SPHPU